MQVKIRGFPQLKEYIWKDNFRDSRTSW